MRVVFVAALSLAALALPACAPCGAGNCSGCCDDHGACQIGGDASACGKAGAACVSCAAGQTCALGACLVPGQGGGDSGGTTSSGATSGGASSNGSGSSGGITSGGTHASASSSSGSSTGGQGTTGGAPAVLSLTASPSTLTPDQPVEISAVVSDPDGIGDLAGAVLDDGQGGSYGAFGTPGGQGTFALTISWSQVNAQHTIELPAGGGTHTFAATFFDAEGHRTTQNIDVALRCSVTQDAVCGGTCVDLQSDSQNCGSCGTQVASYLVCRNGHPACSSSSYTDCGNGCFNLQTDDSNCGACGAAIPSGSTGCTHGHPSCGGNLCATGESCCYGTCSNLSTDSSNCGSCGNQVNSGMVCVGGQPQCPAGQTEESGACYDLQTDVANCGSVGNDCHQLYANRPYITPVCNQGACGFLTTGNIDGLSCDTMCSDHSGSCGGAYAWPYQGSTSSAIGEATYSDSNFNTCDQMLAGCSDTFAHVDPSNSGCTLSLTCFCQ